MADSLTAIPAASQAFASANPGASVAQQVSAGVVKQATPTPASSVPPATTPATTPATSFSSVAGQSALANSQATAAKLTPLTPAPTGSGLDNSGSVVNGGGVTQGAAPQGSTQSSNGNYIGPDGTQYSQGPTASTATPSTVTLVNKDTGQEYTLSNPTSDQINSFKTQGWDVAEGSGDGSGVIDTTQDPAIIAAQAATDQAKQDVANATAQLTSFNPQNDPVLQAQLASIQATWNMREQQMTNFNNSQVASTQTLGYRNGMQYTGGLGGSFGGIITSEEQEGVSRIGDLEAQKQQALSAATTAYSNQEWDRYSKLVDIAEQSYHDQVDQLNKLQTAAYQATKDAQDAQTKAQEDYYTEVTSPIQSIAEDAAKNGADAKTLAAITATTDVGDAVNAAGDWLQTATGDAGDYLQYKRDSATAGQTPVSFQSWETVNEYNKAFATAQGTAAGKASVVGGAGTGLSQGTITSKADIPQALKPYVKQSADGTWYMDLSSVSASQRDSLTTEAGDLPVITDKNQSADLANIRDVNSKLKTVATIMGDLDQPDALSRDLGGAGLTVFASMAQTNPKAAAAGALNDIALDVLKSISGVQGFRGNATAVQQVKDSLPSITDTQDTAAQKLGIVGQLISDRESGILGENGPNDTTNFIVRSERQAQDALTTAGKGNAAIQGQITQVLSSTNPDTGQPYSYLDAAQILGIQIPALAAQTSIFQGGTQLPNLWRELSGNGI